MNDAPLAPTLALPQRSWGRGCTTPSPNVVEGSTAPSPNNVGGRLGWGPTAPAARQTLFHLLPNSIRAA